MRHQIFGLTIGALCACGLVGDAFGAYTVEAWETIKYEDQVGDDNYDFSSYYMIDSDELGNLAYAHVRYKDYSENLSEIDLEWLDTDRQLKFKHTESYPHLWDKGRIEAVNGRVAFGTSYTSFHNSYYASVNTMKKLTENGVEDIYFQFKDEDVPFSPYEEVHRFYGLDQFGGCVLAVDERDGYRSFVYRTAEGEDITIANSTSDSALGMPLKPFTLEYTNYMRYGSQVAYGPDGAVYIGLRADGDYSSVYRFADGAMEKVLSDAEMKGENEFNDDDPNAYPKVVVDDLYRSYLTGLIPSYPLIFNDQGDMAVLAYNVLKNEVGQYSRSLDVITKIDGQLNLAGRLGQTEFGASHEFMYGTGIAHSRNTMLMTNDGRIVFWGGELGMETLDDSLYVLKDGELSVVAASGEEFTDVNGRTFTYWGEDDYYLNAAVSHSIDNTLLCDDAGNVVFFGDLSEDDDLEGIFLFDVSGELTLLLAELDYFWVGPQTTIENRKQIRDLDWRGLTMTDEGELIVGMTFMDDTHGVFTMMIPEPSGLVLLGLGGLMMMRKRRIA
ncbi:PEP-CTERM sorting domain-containing protein [Planctomycetota bacterium]|nr:PEP-CTERM sorting domain-containing protein [Planctomycetota bacterium]